MRGSLDFTNAAPADFAAGLETESESSVQGNPMGPIDRTSLMLGELSAGLEATTNAMKSGFDRMDARFTAMEAAIKDVPPSKECREAHGEFRNEFTRLKIANAKHAGYMGGVAAVATFLLQWVADKAGFHLTF